VQITGVPASGGMRVTTASSADEPESGSSSFDALSIEDGSVQYEGDAGGAHFWSADTTDGDIALIAQTTDGYSSSTVESRTYFAQHGVTLRLDAGKTHAQGVLAPEGLLSPETANKAGLFPSSATFFADATPRTRDTEVLPADDEPSSKASSRPSSTQNLSDGPANGVVLFGQPE
jgi:hypothetical protein